MAGGFAGPYGYGNDGGGFALNALPRLEWSLLWVWDVNQNRWVMSAKRPGRRPLTFRVAIPTRTTRHRQAAVHAQWAPGSPLAPRRKEERVYFFRRFDTGWRQVGRLWASES